MCPFVSDVICHESDQWSNEGYSHMRYSRHYIMPTDTIVSVVTIVLIHLLIYLIQEHMYKLPVSPPIHLVSDQRTCQHK